MALIDVLVAFAEVQPRDEPESQRVCFLYCLTDEISFQAGYWGLALQLGGVKGHYAADAEENSVRVEVFYLSLPPYKLCYHLI